MSANTPGPWAFYTSLQPNGCPIVGARGLMVAMLAHSVNVVDQKDEALSNARLIAAAPDLLEALQAGPSIEHWLPFDNICDCSQCKFVRLRRAAIAKATVQ